MAENRADAFLRMIRRSQRGRLKVYLGYSAGVGKTYQMLLEGHRLKNEGIDVAIGLLETHGRADIARLAQGLEIIPRSRHEYRGIGIEEMDVEAVLARKPQVALIDELAHTNVPGSRNAKRYEDVQDILAAGIHVITTLNIQHLESLYNVVENAVGVKVRERLPDSVLAEADEIVDVDLATADLRQRLEEGKIYPADRIQTALANFFTPSNLEKLRELALRELAAQIDFREARDPGGRKRAGLGPDHGLPELARTQQRKAVALRLAPGRPAQPELVRRLCPDALGRGPGHRRPDAAPPVGKPDPGQAAGRHGLHLQGGGHRRDHSALRQGIPRRPHGRRAVAAETVLEKAGKERGRRRRLDEESQGDHDHRPRHFRRPRLPGGSGADGAAGSRGALRGRARDSGALPAEPLAFGQAHPDLDPSGCQG